MKVNGPLTSVNGVGPLVVGSTTEIKIQKTSPFERVGQITIVEESRGSNQLYVMILLGVYVNNQLIVRNDKGRFI